MESVKSYLLSVICAAIACGLVGTLADKKGSGGVLLKLISGMFLVFTLLSPVRRLEIESFSGFTENLRQDAVSASAYGQQASEEAMAAYIKAEIEAYILDKATLLNGSLSADVTLDSHLQPESVILTGEISDYGKFRMEAILEDDLGIAKENQQWNE